MISTSDLVTLLAWLSVTLSALIVACATVVLVLMGRRITAAGDLLARVMDLESEVNALDRQVAKLRTSKAGTVSNRKREAAAAAPPPPAQDEDEDPFLAGLTPEERALFQ